MRSCASSSLLLCLYSPDREPVRPPGSEPADPLVTHRSCQSQPLGMIEKEVRRRFQGETHRFTMKPRGCFSRTESRLFRHETVFRCGTQPAPSLAIIG